MTPATGYLRWEGAAKRKRADLRLAWLILALLGSIGMSFGLWLDAKQGMAPIDDAALLCEEVP